MDLTISLQKGLYCHFLKSCQPPTSLREALNIFPIPIHSWQLLLAEVSKRTSYPQGSDPHPWALQTEK